MQGQFNGSSKSANLRLKMHPLLIRAGKIALSSNINACKRNFLLGCVGERRDGSFCSAQNGAVITSSYMDYKIIGDAHAEVRCLKRMGKGGILYTARILKKNGSYAMARCCRNCEVRIKMAGVEKVFYTIDDFHYGVFYVELGVDKIVECDGKK